MREVSSGKNGWKRCLCFSIQQSSFSDLEGLAVAGVAVDDFTVDKERTQIKCSFIIPEF